MARQREVTSRGRSRAAAATAPVPPARIAGVDAPARYRDRGHDRVSLRFDLAHLGVTAWNFYRDPFWLHARTVILSSFLLFAGVSLVLADRAGASTREFAKHVGRIAACALLVSAGDLIVFPRSFIWFGVLHAIAVSLVLVRPLVRAHGPRWPSASS